MISLLLSGASPSQGDAPAIMAATAQTTVPAQQPVAPAATAPAASAAPATPSASPTEQSTPAEDAIGNNDIVVQTRRGHAPGDPFEALNTQSFEVVQSADRKLVRPIALAYRRAMPTPLRQGLSNVFRNLDQPVIFVNYILQIKPGKATETLGRFTINSTLGVAGLFDIAKRPAFNLPYRPNGFADSLGYYGVKPGAYFYLPLLGPTTVRDLFGYVVDSSVLPLAVGGPFDSFAFTIPTATLRALDTRGELDQQLHVLHYESVNPYAATRADYLKTRQAEIDALHSKRHSAVPETTVVTP
jgi:phospholipid-binding lipoprotein MlaA